MTSEPERKIPDFLTRPADDPGEQAERLEERLRQTSPAGGSSSPPIREQIRAAVRTIHAPPEDKVAPPGGPWQPTPPANPRFLYFSLAFQAAIILLLVGWAIYLTLGPRNRPGPGDVAHPGPKDTENGVYPLGSNPGEWDDLHQLLEDTEESKELRPAQRDQVRRMKNLLERLLRAEKILDEAEAVAREQHNDALRKQLTALRRRLTGQSAK